MLMLILLFITPPSFHARGSPFFAFSYSSVALSVLFVTLLFFSAPSKSVRILAASTGVLLLIQVIVILSVRRTRNEEFWVGIASILWALLMTIWSIAADRTVQWGKMEEEERLTGRAESRRTVLEWVEVSFASVAFLTLVIVSVLLTCTVILRALDAGLIYPGVKYYVDSNKYQIHVYCHGSKSRQRLPTVLFEGGSDPVEYELWQFAKDAVANGSITRYCFADRPGMAWSDAAPSPLSAGQATEALSEALAHAGETGPWVLVSAGIGSIYSRVFSSRHGEEIQGMLLVDPLHEDLLGRIAKPGRGFSLFVEGILSPLGLNQIPGAIFRGRNKADRVWGRSAYQSAKTIYAKFQEHLVADTLTRRDILASRAIQYSDTPLAIISSGNRMRDDPQWADKQEDLTKITRNLTNWDVVEGAPHEVWRTLEGRMRMEKRIKKLVHGFHVRDEE